MALNEAVSCQAARYRNIFRRTKTMKKAIALAMASVMTAGLLAGCGGSAANSTAASSEAASSEAASTSTEAATEAHTVNTTDPITLTISWWGGDSPVKASGHPRKKHAADPEGFGICR